MNFKEYLNKTIKKNKSLVCLGLDPDIAKIPDHLKKTAEPLWEFNKEIIDATIDLVCAYKPNIAFYEANGLPGLKALYATIKFINKRVPVILDAKRGDIGNTSQAYAKAIFEDFQADAVTLSPYMGFDSLQPFFEYRSKGMFVLCLTSNQGSADFQLPSLYKKVAEKCAIWNNKYKNIGLVVGATRKTQIKEIRKIAPELPFLVPGIGAQGGSLDDIINYGTKPAGQVIINSARNIIYASGAKDFAKSARKAALQLQKEINNKLGI